MAFDFQNNKYDLKKVNKILFGDDYKSPEQLREEKERRHKEYGVIEEQPKQSWWKKIKNIASDWLDSHKEAPGAGGMADTVW